MVCQSCYNKTKNKRKNNDNNTLIQNQQRKIEKNKNYVNTPSGSIYENHACFGIGLRTFGKTFYMLKTFEKIGNKRSIQKIMR